MARETEKAAHAGLTRICGPDIGTPAWLKRPGCIECRGQWPLIQDIYRALTGRELPDTMPPRERRMVDGVFRGPDGRRFIFELDESSTSTTSGRQPFPFTLRQCRLHSHGTSGSSAARKSGNSRAAALRGPNLRSSWRKRPPSQRAFRDALTDILPSEHNFAPTLRLGDFEILDWIFGPRCRLIACPRCSRKGWPRPDAHSDLRRLFLRHSSRTNQLAKS